MQYFKGGYAVYGGRLYTEDSTALTNSVYKQYWNDPANPEVARLPVGG